VRAGGEPPGRSSIAGIGGGGFSEDDDVLAQLLALNKSIAEQEKDGLTEPRRPGNEGLTGTKVTSNRIEAPVRL